MCGFSDQLYVSHELYCEQYVLGNEIDYYLCHNCTTEQQCCSFKCSQQYNGTLFEPRCLSNYVWYDTLEGYCDSKCGLSTLSDLICEPPADDLCTEMECYERECIEQHDYLAVCDLSYLLLTEKQNCTHRWYGTDTIKCYDLVGERMACTQPICDVLKCTDQITYHGTLDIVCADMHNVSTTTFEYFYNTKKEYCQSSKPPFVWCNSMGTLPCTTLYDCCYANCLLDHASFLGRCDTDFAPIWAISDNTGFCDAKCDAARDGLSFAVLTHSSCDDISGTNECSAFECCYLKCLNDNANDKCITQISGPSTFLARNDYCNEFCNGNANYTVMDCPATNCDQNECNILKCLSDLSTRQYHAETVCARKPLTPVLNDDEFIFF